MKDKCFRLCILLLLLAFSISCTTISKTKNQKISLEKEFEEFFENPKEEIRIAVLPIDTPYLTVDEIEALRLHLEERIVSKSNYILIEGQKVNEILDMQKTSYTGLYDENYAIEVGKLLSAKMILITKITTIDDVFGLNFKFVDVEKGQIIKADNIYTKSIEELIYLISPEIELIKLSNEKRVDKKFRNKISIDEKELAHPINYANIKIDGIGDEWDNINPIEFQKYDDNPYYDKLFLAHNNEFIFIRVDIRDQNLFTDQDKHIFVLFSNLKNDTPVDFHIGLTNIENRWSRSLNQNMGTRDSQDWVYNKLTYEYIAIDEVIEMKVNIEWLNNLKTIPVLLGLHDNNLPDQSESNHEGHYDSGILNFYLN